MTSGLVINGVQDALTVAIQILESAREEVVWLIPPPIHSLSMTYGFVEKTRAFVQHGGVVRGIVPISQANIEEIRTSLEVGEDIRHSNEVHELFMYVGERQQSVSAINIGIHDFTLDTRTIAFRSDDSTFAEYLLASFENAWAQAVPAAKRIQELVEQRPL